MDRDSSRWWDWLAAFLLFAAMVVASGRLLATNWIPHLDYVIVLAALGVVLGLALGKSQFQLRAVIGLAIGYTLVIVPWQVSKATEDALAWGERLGSLGGRLIFSLAQLSSRQPVDDFILFLTFVSILFWILCIISAYMLIRHGNILAAVLPGGVAILIVQTYDWVVPQRIWYLGIYLFFALALYGRLNFVKSSREWKQRRVFISPESNLDMSVAIIISAAVLILLAWTMPLTLSSSPAASRLWSNLVEPWNNMKRRFNDAFAALQGTVAAGPRDFFTDNLPLGLGNPLGESILFSVQIPPSARELPRLYWRGRVYDKYENGGWTTTADIVEEFEPDGDSLAPAGQGSGPQGTFYYITYISNQSLLYLLPDLLWLSRAGEYKHFPLPDERTDMVLMRTSRNMKAGETFSARSRLSNPTVLQLRGAGEDYPDWVTERYLQLPEDFSPRVAELAREITQGTETPYDKAVAITNYLRDAIEYVEKIDSPPPDTDPLEWFLFDTKKGFCNYYATAEVLMLRSVGVPARLAAGYAQGQPDEEGSVYKVLQKDAHAWVEVFFPDSGWVEFEPTVNQSPIVRPEGSEQTVQPDNDNTPASTDGQDDSSPGRTVEEDEATAIARQMDYIRYATWVIIVSLAMAAGWLFWRHVLRRAPTQQTPAAILAYFDRRNLPVPKFLRHWALWSEQTPIARAFAIINQSLRWLGKPQPAAATPAERAAILRELLPEAVEEIDALTTQHQTALYSPREGDIVAAKQAGRTIRYKTIRHIISSFFS